MSVKIAVHVSGQPHGFTRGWQDACRRRGLVCDKVNAYEDDIIARLRDYDLFLWHPRQVLPQDLLAARPILDSARMAGLRIFPDWNTAWHFDDKLAQKYLLEAVDAPAVPTHCFFDEEQALTWLESASYPLVWKLRRGAGSANVRLLRDAACARRLCRRMFREGLPAIPSDFRDVKARIGRVRSLRDLLSKLRRRPAQLAFFARSRRLIGREAGYFLVQDFIPDNTFDIRIVVVGDYQWGFTRNVRPGDFRASGSGRIDYDRDRIPSECLRIARNVYERIDAQCLAFDFLLDERRGPMIVEISFGFVPDAIHACPGLWRGDGRWRSEVIHPEDVILSLLLDNYSKSETSDRSPNF